MLIVAGNTVLSAFVEILYTLLPGLSYAEGRRSLASWAAVCLLFYLYTRIQQKRVSKLTLQCGILDDKLRTTSDEHDKLQREQIANREENRLLSSFLSKSTSSQCATVLLRRLVADVAKDCAAIFHWIGDDQLLRFSRGLNEHSTESLSIPATLLTYLADDPVRVLERESLYDSGLLEMLSPQDRGKVRRLTVVAHFADGAPICVLLATRLLPDNADETHQQLLAGQLMRLIGHHLTTERNNEILANQLRLTTDMLKLRKVADKISETPETMIGNYLSCLAHQLHAERIALFPRTGMIGDDDEVIRCGEDLPAGVAAIWKEYEEKLAKRFANSFTLQSVNHAELIRLKITTQIGSAMVVPLVKDGRTIAHICCTRRRTEAFAAPEKDLATWAAEDFTNAMGRLLSHLSVSREARIDGLTELANRREFDERIQREWEHARKHNTPCSLLLFDLDRFKAINDTYGHQAGDYILQESARQFQIHVIKSRHEDDALVARYGGEEFAVLLPGMSEAGALRIGEAIREAIAATDFRFRGLTIKATISGGVATFPDQADSVTTLVAAADSALYSAKQSGRNQIVCASELARLSLQLPNE